MLSAYRRSAIHICRRSVSYQDYSKQKKTRKPNTSTRMVIPSAASDPNVAHCSKTQTFDFLLVLDFEATCEESGPIDNQEIIEMPVAAMRTSTWQIESTFHQYIRPTDRPLISPFCTRLTGIIQEMVDERQPTLPETLEKFDEWVKKLPSKNFAFVTCGDWDLKLMLPSEAKRKGICVPNYFDRWINVKKSYAEHTGEFAKGMKDLLRKYQLTHVGRLHSGIDDVENIAAITRSLGQSGYIYRINGSNVSTTTPRRLFNNTTA